MLRVPIPFRKLRVRITTRTPEFCVDVGSAAESQMIDVGGKSSGEACSSIRIERFVFKDPIGMRAEALARTRFWCEP